MEPSSADSAGRLVAIWRYPVKSMLGEQLDSVAVSPRGLHGDRAFALIDEETGKVASAKNPRRWPGLFRFRAAYRDSTKGGDSGDFAEITLPDGAVVTSDSNAVDERLTATVGRHVRLAGAAVEGASAEGYWPDHDWLPEPDTTFEFTLPPGTFFDGATVHLLATTTLAKLHELNPGSSFDVRRFRPNLVVEPPAGSAGFVENDWIGHTLSIGEVELRVERACPRCVMTTLALDDLPKDPAVLRTAVQHNDANVGVYARVLRGGDIGLGDQVRIL